MRLRSALLLVALAGVLRHGLSASSVSSASLDETTLFAMRWRPSLPKESQTDAEGIVVQSKDGSSYTCFLPAEQPMSSTNQRDEGVDTLVNPLHLIGKLHGTCVYRLESYWSYEFCFGKSLRQFHEDKVVLEGRKKTKVTEYFLGRNTTKASDSSSPTEQHVDASGRPKTLVFDSKDFPYYQAEFKGGDTCDLTGEPRTTRVRYVCVEDSRHVFLAVSEIATCSYEAIIGTSLLCKNPDFIVHEAVENDIICVPRGDSPVKPPALQQLEQDQAMIKESYAAQNAKVKVIRDEHQKIVITIQEEGLGDEDDDSEADLAEIEDEDAEDQHDDSAAAQAGTSSASGRSAKRAAEPTNRGRRRTSSASESSRSSKRPGNDQMSETTKDINARVIKRLVQSHHCFNGGQGWWHFEFCYGKHVKQYHINEDQTRQDILLGTWDEEYHRKMYKQLQPDRRHRRAFTHYYKDGDFCEETGQNRKVSVQMTCSTKLTGGRVALYLEEPQTCVYKLTVRSSVFCDFMDSLDEDGVPDV